MWYIYELAGWLSKETNKLLIAREWLSIRQDSNSLESLFKSIIMKKIECCTLPRLMILAQQS
jgi:hypothetical protein